MFAEIKLPYFFYLPITNYIQFIMIFYKSQHTLAANKKIHLEIFETSFSFILVKLEHFSFIKI